MAEERPKDHPIWDVYNLQRTSRFWAKHFERKVNQTAALVFWMDVITTLFAGSSAIAGFAFWNDPIGHPFWVAGAAVATILSVLKPILKLTDRLRLYQKLFTGYVDLASTMDSIALKVRQERTYSASHTAALLLANEKGAALRVEHPAEWGNKKFRLRLQDEVNRELPVDRFYFPG